MDDDPKLINSRIINTYVKLIKRKYAYIDIVALLQYAGMELYQVEDEAQWFSLSQVDRFYERLVDLTGNKEIAREAGRYNATPEMGGIMRSFVLGFIGPNMAFELLPKIINNFVKSASYAARRVGLGRVEISVTPVEGIKERHYQCENRMGFFEAIGIGFDKAPPRIEHPECIFQGGRECRYLISWHVLRSDSWKKLRNYAFIAFVFGWIANYILAPQIALFTVLPVLLLLALVINLLIWHIERKELLDALNNMRGSTDQLLESVNKNYNNALLIREIGLVLSKHMDIDSVVTSVIQVLEKRLEYDRGMILLANHDRTRLVFKAGFGYEEHHRDLLQTTYFNLEKPGSRGPFVVSFLEEKPMLVADIAEIKGVISSHSLQLAETLGAKSFICCPITYEKGSLGILAVDNKRTKRPLTQSDVSLLMGVATEIGISIRNAMLEEELLKAKKLDSLGILAGGIAHDFNNLITGILGNISLAKALISHDDTLASQRLYEAEKASERAKELTQQLLTFSKGGAPLKRPLSLDGLLRESANFVLRGSNVRCELEMPNGLWAVEADEGQMSQVFNNLIINADQAMPEGGIIRIKAENIVVSDTDTMALKTGKYVKVAVRDQGIGIGEAHLQKIFDPYFTTKKRGSGLGLATVYSIVNKHGGHVTVDSQLGMGTTFHVYLPATDSRPVMEVRKDERVLRDKGRVLVMDDEDIVRDVATEMLRHIGYEVVFCKDGEEAIGLYEKARATGTPFDAVIMDLTIPGGMGGKDTMEHLRQLDPMVKGIVSSGYSNDPIIANYQQYGFSGVVVKPYKLKDLGRTLQDVIGGSAQN